MYSYINDNNDYINYFKIIYTLIIFDIYISMQREAAEDDIINSILGINKVFCRITT